MPPVPHYYGSCSPRPQGPISLDDLTSGRPRHGKPGSVTRPAHASPRSPVLPQQPAIVFTDAYGTRVPINKKTARRIVAYAASNGERPIDGAEPEDSDFFAPFTSIDAIVQKEERRRIRKDVGHHFGGYHPGKNTRQTPSIKYVGDMASKVSRLFGLPVYELVSAAISFREVEEQQRHEAWVNEAVASNGHYK